MKKIYKNVCWTITYKCLYNCEFCHSFNCKDIKELPIEKNIEILNKLINLKCKKITWSGGDPLFYDGISKLLLLAKENGIYTSLATTPLGINNIGLNCLSDKLDLLILPLDGSCDKVQYSMGRGKEHFTKVCDILNRINLSNFKFKVRINTVVSSINYDDIILISELIKKFNISKWKLYQFAPIRGRAKQNKLMYEISTHDFLILKEKILMNMSNSTCDVSFVDNVELQQQNIIVRADGSVVRTNKLKDNIICDYILNLGVKGQ